MKKVATEHDHWVLVVATKGKKIMNICNKALAGVAAS